MASMEGEVEKLSQSMATLGASNQRPDIKMAEEANAVIKSKLGYRDDEELDTGVQKVQPLPFLDEEIQKYHAQIRNSVTPAEKVNDTVPSEVLRKVDRATMLATEGATSLFKASQLLEFTFDAYQYARGAAQSQFNLERKAELHLAKFEEAFRNMIHHRVEADLSNAALELDNCQKELESALEEGRRDVRLQEDRAREEDAVIQDSSLRESHEQVQEMVRMEMSELNVIGEQCLKDMKTIDEELSVLKQRMSRAEQQYRLKDGQRLKRLEENRGEQKRLEERLRLLKEEEEKLVRETASGEKLQREADEVYAGTERDVLDWRGKIENLRSRTTTSLAVMTCIEECTDIIMADAKGKKAMWKRRLREMAVESQWILRECLVMKGAAYMMVLEDNKNNAAECTKLIAHYEGEKISAARHGFAPRVNEAKKSIEQYSMARTEYEEKMRESSETIKAIRGELATLDEQLHTLRPGLKLDTLENRFDGLKRRQVQAFDAMTTEGIAFSFYHRLPH